MRMVVLAVMVLAGVVQAKVTDRMIANMFVLGFEGKSLSSNAPIVRAVCDQGLGGVLLFKKNVATAGQVRAMTRQLSRCPHKPLIAVDQEGGKVRRIRFGQEYARASEVAKRGLASAKNTYAKMAKELHALGINYNLAPVADLDIQPRNYIIHKLGRSYGRDPGTVTAYDNVFIQAMHRHHVLTSLKHFPGHGSSLGDTHQGFVDVTHQWQRQELSPFLNPKADSVMVAHVVNEAITEPGRPASLSARAIRTLRQGNPRVVVITDDLQMGAIRKHYSLQETIRLAIKAGNDLLLFGNQLSRKHTVEISQLVTIVRSLIRRDKSIEKAVRSANRRIARMRRKIGLRDGKTSPAISAKKPHIPTSASDMF